jgi:hypothetical protein
MTNAWRVLSEMAPVPSPAQDSVIDPTGNLIATIVTFGLAVVALVLVVRLCVKDRIVWPALALVGGTVTCLLEPLFDHLYGLWFPSIGAWTLFTTYGVHEPIWLPAAYLVIYGALPVLAYYRLRAQPTQRTVWQIYAVLVVVAIVAEIFYIQVGAYNYQYRQPFVVLGYPLFLGFVNSMSALIAGLAMYRLVPALRGRHQLALMAIPPLAFGVDAVGSGVLYLALRHSENPSTLLLHLGAITVVIGGALTVRLLAMLLPDGGFAPDDAAPAGTVRARTLDEVS